MNLPRILLTPGEPAGIGPDLAVMLAQREFAAEIVVVADPDLLSARARQLQLPLSLESFDAESGPSAHQKSRLRILPLQLAAAVEPGRLDTRNAGYVLESLRRAVALCQSQDAAAMVTGPVQKSVINQAGHAFSGHTEFLAELTGTQTPVMMLYAPWLRVALVTTHLPLRQVADAITPERLMQVIRVVDRELCSRFGVVSPHIAVTGLNPHAGEGGHLGREEIEVIAPTLEKLRAEGLHLTGPVPADTLFTPENLQRVDAVVAMYHDQGLPVLKHMGFGRIVNITLGLPILRTSVDHGTALELAGSGRADPASLVCATEAAIELSARRPAGP